MNKSKIIAACATLTFVMSNLCVAQKSVHKTMHNAESNYSINIMSYNIRHGEGLDDITDYGRIAHIITDNNADLVAVQEVDSVTERSNDKYVLGEIASQAGMYPTFARAIPFMGGAYGIGILSKEKPISTKCYPLPGREEERVLLIAEFDNIFFGCMHLSLTPEDQMASLPIIVKVASNLNKPFVIAGDWNATPSDEFIKEMNKHVTFTNDMSTATFPANKPDTLLDYIAIWKQHETKSNIHYNDFYVVKDTIASDHRPVVTQITIKN